MAYTYAGFGVEEEAPLMVGGGAIMVGRKDQGGDWREKLIRGNGREGVLTGANAVPLGVRAAPWTDPAPPTAAR